MQTKWISIVVGIALAFSTANVFADHMATVIGAAAGGATGAAIGQHMGGRNDAIIWSAIGGAAGAALGHSLGEPHERRPVIMRERYADDDDYVVVRRPVHVQHIYYETEPRYWKHEHRRHHEREWDDDD